jgi:peroxin-14
MEPGPDPFEEVPSGPPRGGGGVPSGPVSDSESLREAIVQQAVKFLTDPRVKAANPQRALDFLLGKNLTLAEIREAFRRVNREFPGAPGGSAFPGAPGGPGPSNILMVPPGSHVSVRHGRRGTSWASLFWGLTAAAGAVALIRELLRRYVVPLYFPEMERAADEHRRTEGPLARRSDEEIGS